MGNRPLAFGVVWWWFGWLAFCFVFSGFLLVFYSPSSCCVSLPFNDDLGTPPTRRPYSWKKSAFIYGGCATERLFSKSSKALQLMTLGCRHHSCCNFRASCSNLPTATETGKDDISLAYTRRPPLIGLHGQPPASRYSELLSSRIQAHQGSLIFSNFSHVSPQRRRNSAHIGRWGLLVLVLFGVVLLFWLCLCFSNLQLSQACAPSTWKSRVSSSVVIPVAVLRKRHWTRAGVSLFTMFTSLSLLWGW